MLAQPRPTFAVVIPAYNRAATLPRAIDSVLRQTFADFELIVVDDGSTDETAVLVNSYRDPRIRYVFQENQGRSAARNRGAREATAEFLVFLDSDDEACPEWLQTLRCAVLEADCDVVHCGAYCLNADGTVGRCRRPEEEGPAFRNRRLSYLAGTFALRRDIFQSLGGYVVGLEMCENTELHLRLVQAAAARGWRFHSLETPLIRYHRYGETIVGNPARMPATVDFLLESHGDAFAADPQTTARYCRVAGVCAARCGDYRTARRFFAAAITASPLEWQDYLRLLIACCPGASRRVWPIVRTA